MSLWRFYKLSDEVAIEELLRGRVRGIRNHIAEISFVQEQLKQRREAAMREVLEVRLSQLQKPARCLPAVTEWLQLYTDGFGSRSRFPFPGFAWTFRNMGRRPLLCPSLDQLPRLLLAAKTCSNPI